MQGKPIYLFKTLTSLHLALCGAISILSLVLFPSHFLIRPKRPPFLAFSFSCSLACLICSVCSFEKFSIENSTGRISSFSLVVKGSFDKNWIMIDRMCFRCSSTWPWTDIPPLAHESRLRLLFMRPVKLSTLVRFGTVVFGCPAFCSSA
jgi:hypothetical protein